MADTTAISAVASAIGNAAPYAGAITALATLGIDITKLITPDAATQNENQRLQNLTQADDLMSAWAANPTPDADNALAAFDDELCLAAGYPIIGGVPTQCVNIGVQRWLTHQAIVAEYIALRQLLDQLTAAKQSSAQSAVGAPPSTGKVP